MARKAKKHHSTKSDMKQPAKPLEIQVTSCIQQLPTELLREIFSWCRNASNRLEVQGILCLVSRRFKEVAQPMQLATIALGGFSDTQRRKVSQLKALAAGSSSASRFAQTIVIDYSDDFEYDPTIVMSQLEQAMLKNLTAAIRSFERVSRVIWNFGHEYPTWMPDLVFEGLKSLPLIDLTIRFPDDSWPEFELPPLPNLRRFSIRLHSSPQRLQPPLGRSLLNFIRQCTQLSHLEVDMHLPSLAHVLPVVDTDTSPLPLKHLSLKNVLVTSDNLNSSLAHLRELVSFCLYSAGCEHRLIKAAPDGSLAGRNPWTVFSDAGIHLNNILTDTPWDASLLAYLEKTPGLNSLTICSSGYGSIFLDDPSFHKTLQLLVPRVASCLVELSIVPQLPRRSDWPHRPDWCCPFNESIVLILSQLKHLRRLNLTLDMAKLVLGTLCHGAEPQMEESLKPILLMCDKLPALEELSLQLYNSYSWILENPEASVHQVFESFASGGSLLDTSQYLVLVHRSAYILHRSLLGVP